MTSYTLFGQAATGAAIDTFTATLTNGILFSVTSPATLTAVWFYSAPGAAILPSRLALFDTGTATAVPGTEDTAPSWSGPAGSGWVRYAFPSPPPLTPGTSYTAAVSNSPGSGSEWYPITAGSWSGGITSGILTCPDQADVFDASGWAFPGSAYGNFNIWIDPEVTPAASPVSLAESGTGGESASGAAAVPLTDPGAGADAGLVAAAVPVADPGAGNDAAAVASSVALAEPGAASDAAGSTAALGLEESGSGSAVLTVGGGGDPPAPAPPPVAPFPDVELLLIAWLQPLFPGARFATELPADIAETTVHVTRISGAARSIRVDRPIVDIDVYALGHAASVNVALAIEALLRVARNVVTENGVLLSASTVNGPRWLPEPNPDLRRRSATYMFHVHA